MSICLYKIHPYKYPSMNHYFNDLFFRPASCLRIILEIDHNIINFLNLRLRMTVI